MFFPRSKPLPYPPPRVVITGAGIVSALGIGWRQNAEGFRAGRTAFRPVSLFDVSRQRVRTAAEVALPPVLPATRLTPREVARLDRAGAMLLLAAHEAWVQSGWEPAEDTAPGPRHHRRWDVPGRSLLPHRGARRRTGIATNPPARLHYQAQTQARTLADALGFSGPITIISNACASGANAIGHAWELIRRGQAERVVAGGYDALSQMVFSGFDSLQALSPTACRPFDAAAMAWPWAKARRSSLSKRSTARAGEALSSWANSSATAPPSTPTISPSPNPRETAPWRP